ncbi:MAG TPA: hypothetical protein VFZ58_04100 [Candidatus Saccharimonadales bacterium]
MASEILPRLESITPDIVKIRQHVRAQKRGDVDKPIEACIEFRDGHALRQLQVTFGRHALFATADLSFQYHENGSSPTGILLKDERGYYVSTPFVAQFGEHNVH